MKFIDFRAFDPPTLDTFAQCWRNKVWHLLLRAMKDRDEPARAAFWLGQADAAVSVLYDINHPAAYRAKERYNLVFRICQDIAEDMLHELEFKLRRSTKVYG